MFDFLWIKFGRTSYLQEMTARKDIRMPQSIKQPAKYHNFHNIKAGCANEHTVLSGVVI